MKNILFYLFTVLIWGSTWLGIKLQLGVVAPLPSVTYRFGLAALILLSFCCLSGRSLRFSVQQHCFMFLQGVLLFGFNYLCFYLAEQYLTSGLAAVIFSTILWMNVINGALFLRVPISLNVIIGGGIGLVGILMVFRPELSSVSATSETLQGILLSILATLLASLGNIVSARNQKAGLPIVQTNGWGMLYGAIIMLLVTLATGSPFSFDWSLVYVGSLVYLALFGSVIAFGCYLSLVGSIGADRAAYATLLFPIVALVISTLFENYHWTTSSLVGVGLILVGNFWMIGTKSVAQRERLLRLINGLRRTKQPGLPL